MMSLAGFGVPSVKAQSDEGADAAPIKQVEHPARPVLQEPLFLKGVYFSQLSLVGGSFYQSGPLLSGAPSAPGWQQSMGYTAAGGWQKHTPRTTYSVELTTMMLQSRGPVKGTDWNEYGSARVSRRVSERLRVNVFGRTVLTDEQQFLFRNPDAGAVPDAEPAIPSSNLLLTERDLFSSVGIEFAYDYSPITTFTAKTELTRDTALGGRGVSPEPAGFSTWNALASSSVARVLSPTTQITGTVSVARTMSQLDNSRFLSALVGYVWAFSQPWSLTVEGGTSLASQSAAQGQVKPYPIGGAALIYHRQNYSLSLQSHRSIVQVYGAGAGIVWSSNVSWRLGSPQSRWAYIFLGGYDRSETIGREGLEGWRLNATLRRAINKKFGITSQFGSLGTSYRFPANLPSQSSAGVRVGLEWLPNGV